MCLEQATQEILAYINSIKSEDSSFVRRLMSGESTYFKVLDIGTLGIYKILLPENTYDRWRIHSNTEHVILYKGTSVTFESIVDKKVFEKTIRLGGSCYFNPGQTHRVAKVVGECWLLMVIIPGAISTDKDAVYGR